MAELLDLPRLSLQERDARWGRVRAAMAERDVACIIVPPHTGHFEQFGADNRYLTHIGGNNSETACVFPLEGDVTAIVLNRPDFWMSAQEWVSDIRTPRRFMWAPTIIERMKELGIAKHRVAVSGISGGVRSPEGTISHSLYESLKQAFPQAIFEDVTVTMAELRAVKSPEELGCLERATDIIEQGIKAMVEVARPGVPDHEVYAALWYAMMKAGAELPSMVLWGSGPGDPHDAFLPTRRPLQRGDILMNEIEGKYLGYQAQRVQPAVLGDAPARLLSAMDKQRTVFDAARERMKPGTPFGQISEVVDEVSRELGCQTKLTMHGRGLGEDRPMLVYGDMAPETAAFVLQEGNTFIMKPNVSPAGGPGITWGDTVAVTPLGGRRLGKDPHELVVIPC